MSWFIAVPELSIAAPQPHDLAASAGLARRARHPSHDRFLPAALCAECLRGQGMPST